MNLIWTDEIIKKLMNIWPNYIFRNGKVEGPLLTKASIKIFYTDDTEGDVIYLHDLSDENIDKLVETIKTLLHMHNISNKN